MLQVEDPNDKTLEMLDWQIVLDALSAKCQSYYGRIRVENNHWLNNIEDIRQRYRVISELNDIHERGYRLPFGGVTNCDEGLNLLENNMNIESRKRPSGYLEREFLKNFIPRFFL